MGTIFISDEVAIPAWIVDHASFRQWARSAAYPEQGKISYLHGDLWVDVSMEKLIHNHLKTVIVSTLFGLLAAQKLGRVLSDRMMLTHVVAGLSTEPDGLYFSFDALERGQVGLQEGGDAVEVEGAPEMVLEVISPHSVKKDTIILPSLYWAAQIAEYWLVDPRKEPATLTLFQRGDDAYQAVRKQGGWLRSLVFGKSFRLRMEQGPQGLKEYVLDFK